MRFYCKLVRIMGETILSIELANGTSIQQYSITRKILARHWKQ